MIIPIWSQSSIAELLGTLLGFSFGLAADKGFNSSLGATWSPKSALGKWFLSVIQQGWHHFFIGLALMYFTAPYTQQNWGLFLYCLGLGLVVSEAKLVAHLLAEFGASLQQLPPEVEGRRKLTMLDGKERMYVWRRGHGVLHKS